MAVPSDIKLALYNGALQRLGSRELASLSENREPRRVLDRIWGAANEIVLRALEAGEWNFAIRTVEGIYSPSIEPGFGFARAYDKPDDCRRLAALSADPYFRVPLTNDQYADEAGYWFTDHEQLFIRYVSDDGSYGLNAAGWPEMFKDYLECDLAWRACERITNSASKKQEIERARAAALKGAKSHDAMQEGVKFPPQGSWAAARGGMGRRERSRLG